MEVYITGIFDQMFSFRLKSENFAACSYSD